MVALWGNIQQFACGGFPYRMEFGEHKHRFIPNSPTDDRFAAVFCYFLRNINEAVVNFAGRIRNDRDIKRLRIGKNTAADTANLSEQRRYFWVVCVFGSEVHWFFRCGLF